MSLYFRRIDSFLKNLPTVRFIFAICTPSLYQFRVCYSIARLFVEIYYNIFGKKRQGDLRKFVRENLFLFSADTKLFDVLAKKLTFLPKAL